MKAIVNGKVYYESRFQDGLVLVYDERIKEIKRLDEVDLSICDEVFRRL